MAFVGMKHPVWAPIREEIEGQPVVYDTGLVIGEAISADVTFTRSNNPLYADDKLSESDNSITGGTVSLTVNEIEDATLAKIMDMEVGADGEYEETSSPSPYGGLGYMRARRKKGKTTYTAMWLYKVQLGITSETATTKGEQIDYQTPTLEGNMMGVVNDGDMKTKYRSRKTFETEAEAIAWLDAKAKVVSA